MMIIVGDCLVTCGCLSFSSSGGQGGPVVADFVQCERWCEERAVGAAVMHQAQTCVAQSACQRPVKLALLQPVATQCHHCVDQIVAQRPSTLIGFRIRSPTRALVLITKETRLRFVLKNLSYVPDRADAFPERAPQEAPTSAGEWAPVEFGGNLRARPSRQLRP